MAKDRNRKARGGPHSGGLVEQELGLETPDLCRKHGISEAALYNW